MKKILILIVFLKLIYFSYSYTQINWESLNLPPYEGDLEILGIGPDGCIYLGVFDDLWGSEDYLFYSSDEGNTWQEVPFFSNSKINDMVVDKENNMYLVAGEWHMGGREGRSGIFMSPDSGKSWNSLGYIGCEHDVSMTLDNTNNLLVVDESGTVAGSKLDTLDFHELLNSLNNPMFEGRSSTCYNHMDISANSDNQYFLTKLSIGGMVFSLDGGNEWTKINSPKHNHISSIAFPDSSNYWIIATYESGVFQYDPLKKTWWNIGLKDYLISDMKQLSNRLLIVSAENRGIFYSADMGTTWEEMEGPGTNNISSFFVSEEMDLYVSTFEHQIFKINLKELGILGKNTVTINDYYINCYPNPFKDKSVFHYTLEKPGNIQLTVFDIQGKLIEKIVDEFQNSGDYTITWRPKNIKSGLYFYQFIYSNFLITKTIIKIE